jgi:predicted  nucleic acid-binding Zn-ribbon protein
VERELAAASAELQRLGAQVEALTAELARTHAEHAAVHAEHAAERQQTEDAADARHAAAEENRMRQVALLEKEVGELRQRCGSSEDELDRLRRLLRKCVCVCVYINVCAYMYVCMYVCIYRLLI